MTSSQHTPDSRAAQRLHVVMEHIRLENAHDLPGVMDTFGADAFYDVPAAGAHLVGRPAVQGFYETQFNAAPDLQVKVDTIHAASESIVLEVTISGTHTGADWMGLPAKGKAFSYPLCAVYLFGPDGKLAGERIYFDLGFFARQLQ